MEVKDELDKENVLRRLKCGAIDDYCEWGLQTVEYLSSRVVRVVTQNNSNNNETTQTTSSSLATAYA